MKLVKIGLSSLLLMSLVGCASNGSADAQTSAAPSASATTGENTIHVYTRDSSSGTREAFEKGIGMEGDALTSNASEVSSNGDMATRVGADVNGIGYTSLTTDFDANNIKPLAFEGVQPSVDAVLDGSYSLQRPFVYTLRAEYASDDLQQLVLAFIDYITLSQEGMAVLSENGGIVDDSNAKPWSEIAANYPVLNQDNSSLTIKTGGSTSVEHCIKAALESFSPLAGNVQFAMNQTGSSDGFKRTLGDEKDGPNAVDIGFASRSFKSEETVADGLGNGQFCLDAVVAVVNKSNTLENVTAAQLNSIYTGAILNFSDIK